MPHRLSVSPDGLYAASAALHERASQLLAVNGGAPAGRTASSVGVASVSRTIAAFGAAYAGRLADRGQSAEVAAASYTTVDDDGAADIGRVSV